MNQTDIEEIDKSQEHESDGQDASESDTEEPLDDTSIRCITIDVSKQFHTITNFTISLHHCV